MMTQTEFLEDLERRLGVLPAGERRRAVDFYRELIQDGMESGKSEEEAVDALGSPETAAAALLEEQPVQSKLQALDEKNRELACGGVTEILVDVRDQPVVLEPSPDDWLHVYYREDSGDNYHYSTEGGRVCLIHRHILGPMSLIRGFYHLIQARRILIQLPSVYAGRLEVRTTNNSIRAEGFPFLNEAVFHSSNGSITLSLIGCARMEASTSNAAIILSNIKADSAVVISSNASLTLDAVKAENALEVRTSNGQIQLTEVAAQAMTATTSNGKIQFTRLAAPAIRLKSSNGALRGSIVGNPHTYSVTGRTSNARCTLPCWEDPAMPNRLEAITSNGAIDISFCE